jgi:hypothetical protein
MSLTGEFDPKNFLSQVEEKNSSGHPVPDWKKMIIARQLAEKAFKESEEKRKATGFFFSYYMVFHNFI